MDDRQSKRGSEKLLQAWQARALTEASVREIAAGAGVTAMLVNRYFGSKEQLFSEVAARTMSESILMSPEIMNAPSRGKAFATGLVAMTRKPAASAGPTA